MTTERSIILSSAALLGSNAVAFAMAKTGIGGSHLFSYILALTISNGWLLHHLRTNIPLLIQETKNDLASGKLQLALPWVKYCPSCGTKIHRGEEQCGHCSYSHSSSFNSLNERA